jgi:hypothetical protein
MALHAPSIITMDSIAVAGAFQESRETDRRNPLPGQARILFPEAGSNVESFPNAHRNTLNGGLNLR